MVMFALIVRQGSISIVTQEVGIKVRFFDFKRAGITGAESETRDASRGDWPRSLKWGNAGVSWCKTGSWERFQDLQGGKINSSLDYVILASGPVWPIEHITGNA